MARILLIGPTQTNPTAKVEEDDFVQVFKDEEIREGDVVRPTEFKVINVADDITLGEISDRLNAREPQIRQTMQGGEMISQEWDDSGVWRPMSRRPSHASKLVLTAQDKLDLMDKRIAKETRLAILDKASHAFDRHNR